LLARDHFQKKEDGKGERGRDVLFPFSERGGKRPARLYEEEKKERKKKRNRQLEKLPGLAGQDLDAREENARKGNHVMLALTALQAYPVV
jgi:hypothetical protein